MAYILITYQIEVRTKFLSLNYVLLSTFDLNLHIEILFMRTAFLCAKDYHTLRSFDNKEKLKGNYHGTSCRKEKKL